MGLSPGNQVSNFLAPPDREKTVSRLHVTFPSPGSENTLGGTYYEYWEEILNRNSYPNKLGTQNNESNKEVLSRCETSQKRQSPCHGDSIHHHQDRNMQLLPVRIILVRYSTNCPLHQELTKEKEFS
jgi:hypothetical protein